MREAADAADVDAGCQVIAKLAEAALDEPAEAADPFDKASQRLSAHLVRGIEFGKTVDHVVEVRMSAARRADGPVESIQPRQVTASIRGERPAKVRPFALPVFPPCGIAEIP